MKTCSKCQIEKSEELFAKGKGYCKECHSNYMKDYFKRNPDKAKKNRGYVRISKPTRRNKLRVLLKQLKSNPCTDCKQIFHPEVMDFDHIQPKGKRNKAISCLINLVPSVEAMLTEIAKCELVCANCHRIRTIKRRVGEIEYFKQVGRPGAAPGLPL